MTKTDTEAPAQAPVAFAGRNPDVLTCIANLSNDEVFTPPEFANQMLDTLAEAWSASHDGASIWENSTVTFLDPFTKSGVFLREITKRLVDGLAAEIPDLHDRVDHILTKQVYASASPSSRLCWPAEASTAPSGRTANTRSPSRSTTPTATSGSNASNTPGLAEAKFSPPTRRASRSRRSRAASAASVAHHRRLSTGAVIWSHMPTPSSTPTTSRPGWPTSLEQTCSST